MVTWSLATGRHVTPTANRHAGQSVNKQWTRVERCCVSVTDVGGLSKTSTVYQSRRGSVRDVRGLSGTSGACPCTVYLRLVVFKSWVMCESHRTSGVCQRRRGSVRGVGSLSETSGTCLRRRGSVRAVGSLSEPSAGCQSRRQVVRDSGSPSEMSGVRRVFPRTKFKLVVFRAAIFSARVAFRWEIY